MNTWGKRIASSAMATSLGLQTLLCNQCLANENPAERAAFPAASIQLGRPPVHISGPANLLVCIQGDKDNSILGSLVSINGIFSKGMSREEIAHLLLGPVGSEVEISIINDSEQQVTSHKLTRVPVERADIKGPQDKTLQQIAGALDNGYDLMPAPMDVFIATDYERENLDLCVRGALSQCLNAFDDDEFALQPPPKAHALEWATVISDRIGDISRADKYLDDALKFNYFNEAIGTDQNAIVISLLKDLAATKRKSEGEKFARGFADAADFRAKYSRLQLSDRTSVLVSCCAFFASQNSQQLNDFMKRMDASLKASPNFFYVSDETEGWNARVYEQHGQPKQAARIYTELLKNSSIASYKKGKVDFGLGCYYICQANQATSALADSLQFDAAISTATNSLNLINDLMTEEQLSLTEKVGPIETSRSTLETQLASLYLKQNNFKKANDFAIAAKKHIEQTLGTDSYLVKKSLLVHPVSIEDQFDNVKLCIQQARNKDVAGLKKTVANLLETYKNTDYEYWYTRPQLNLFTVILAQARVLADLCEFDESDRVLDKLQTLAVKECTPTALKFIDVERALNAELRNKSTPELWAKINTDFTQPSLDLYRKGGSGSPHKSKIDNTFINAENCRALAVIYNRAGENSRAQILINHALEANAELQAMACTNADIDINVLRWKKTIMLLDKANIKASCSKVAEADEIAREAINLSATAPALENSQLQSNVNAMFKDKLVGLSKQYQSIDKIKGLATARALLETALSSTKAESEGASSPNKFTTQDIAGYSTRLREQLARIYYREGNIPEAFELIKPVLSEGNSCTRISRQMLIAEICRAACKYNDAARYYLLAEQSTGLAFMQNHILHHAWSNSILRRAAECADKSIDMDKLQKANIFILYANSMNEEGACQVAWDKDPEEQIALYKKAYELIPDSYADKPRLQQRLEIAQAALQQSKNIKGQTAEESKIAEAKNQLASVKETLRLTEQSNPQEAWLQLLSLAQVEANAHMPSDALEHATRAIELFGESKGGIGRFRLTLSEVPSIALALAGQLPDTKVEKLLNVADDKTAAVFGRHSHLYSLQMACDAQYHFGRGEYSKAMHLIDIALLCPPRSLNLYRESVLEKLLQCESKVSKNDASQIELVVENKILAVYKKGLDPDDKRIYVALQERAKCKEALQDYAGALKDVYASLAIMKLYESDKELNQYSSQTLPALLRKSGQEKEAVEASREFEEPPGYIDSQYPYEHQRIVVDQGATPEEQIAKWKREFAEAKTQAPYSNRTSAAATTLYRLAAEQKIWQTAHDMACWLCIDYEHRDDPTAGISYGCIPGPPRIGPYKNVIDADFKLKNGAEVVSYIKRAAAKMPQVSYLENLQLCELSMQSNDLSLARQFAAQAEELLPYEDYIYDFNPSLRKIWLQLGEPEKSARAQAQVKEILRRYKESMDRVQSNPLNRSGL